MTLKVFGWSWLFQKISAEVGDTVVPFSGGAKTLKLAHPASAKNEMQLVSARSRKTDCDMKHPRPSRFVPGGDSPPPSPHPQA